jgi:hypothetical protein
VLPTDYDEAVGQADSVTIAGYGIDFVNGVGTLGGFAETPPVTSDGRPDAADLVGAVAITPNRTIACPGDPVAVATFSVIGALTASREPAEPRT